MKSKFNIVIISLFSIATIIAGSNGGTIKEKLALEAQKTIEIDGSIYRISETENIKVIDGYHSIYPLSYKIKFRKIIERVLENDIKLKNYYDNWGSRVYAFYTNQNNIELNFFEAKRLGASYVISKFPIKDNDLKIVCYECNNSKNIFLYKIL